MSIYELQIIVPLVILLALVIGAVFLINKYRTQYLKFIRVLTSWQLFVASVLFIYVANLVSPEFGYTLFILSMPVYAIIFALAYSQSTRRPVRWFDHKSFKLTRTELDAINEKDVAGLQRINRRQQIIYIIVLIITAFLVIQFIF